MFFKTVECHYFIQLLSQRQFTERFLPFSSSSSSSSSSSYYYCSNNPNQLSYTLPTLNKELLQTKSLANSPQTLPNTHFKIISTRTTLILEAEVSPRSSLSLTCLSNDFAECKLCTKATQNAKYQKNGRSHFFCALFFPVKQFLPC